MISISNNTLSVIILEKGAELQSIRYEGIEYLWQADATYWPKHAPVLFPIVGELKDGKYIYEDKEYRMARHGFARDKVFEVKQTSATSAIFTLQDDEETQTVYPFRFIFKVEYKLEGNELFCTFIVENRGDKTMYFSVGGHPAFNVPLQGKLQYTDYVLQFDDDTVLNRYLLHDGLTGDDTEPITLDDQTLRLHPSLFYDDAIVLKHINSRQVKLLSDKDTHGLQFRFDGFPYFGIWAAKDALFVCLEPWCGIADSIHHDYQLIHKEGINQLAPGENRARGWSVKVT